MTRHPILDHAAQLAEPLRCRLLRLVETHELTVSDLCAVLQAPQSTVSRHLKVLAEGGWVLSRRDGTSNLYRAADLDGAARELWTLVHAELASTPELREDRRRLEAVLQERRSRSREFFSATAGRWDAVRDELFGHRFDLEALLGLVDPTWTVGDLACGTGRASEALAPWVERVIAVDDSSAMLDAARERLSPYPNVTIREGELERLPLPDVALDAAFLFLALHHVPEPAAVIAEAHRVLRPGGRLLVLDMLPHTHEEFRAEMGHVWLGFDETRVERLLEGAGLDVVRVRPLRPDPEAQGPGLFVATGAATENKVPDADTPPEHEDAEALAEPVTAAASS